MAEIIERLFGLDGENSKADLRETDIQLTTEVHKLEKQYKTAYQHIVELRNAYISSRRFIVFERYAAIKAMIKACCSENVLEDANETHLPKRGLLQAAEQFLSNAEEYSVVKNEVAHLNKTEYKEDINMKKEKREKIKSRLEELHKRVQELKEQYEESKQFHPLRRYRAMKTMIKSLIKDKTLVDVSD